MEFNSEAMLERIKRLGKADESPAQTAQRVEKEYRNPMFKLEFTRDVETINAGLFPTREAVNAEIARREEITNDFVDSGKYETESLSPDDAIEGYNCLVTNMETGEQFVVESDDEWIPVTPD